ncbi:uncharacterized protein LOC109444073 [Rhinolophus sinicus]|uniref:uncharacterized protein LOC109444073 n=1 Tax=Rhinolophus sinicus TaxID=89399 RepID=UPI003D7A3448
MTQVEAEPSLQNDYQPRTYPAPLCCLPARRARSRAHSLFLLPRRAAGRRRFLPDASRRPAAPPAVRAGRPGKAGWAAGSAPGRRPLRAEGRRAGAAGCAAPAETRRGNQLRRRSLFRGPPRKPGPPAHFVGKVQGTPVIPSRGPDSWMFPAAQLIVTAALGPKSGLGQRSRARLLKMTPVCPGSRTAGQPEDEMLSMRYGSLKRISGHQMAQLVRA